MFEIIGLLLGAVLFFALSAVLGVIYALFAWLLVRRRRLNFLPIVIAAAIPPLCAVYMAICLIALPDVSLFGDISEPLPNGFVLKALGKMPDYGDIESKGSYYQPPMLGWIGKVDLEGDVLYGTYSHSFNGTSEDVPVQPCCFALNTKTQVVQSFVSIDAMNHDAHRKLALSDIPKFHSNPQAYSHQMTVRAWILFGPCALTILLYTAVLLQWRRRTDKRML